MRNIDAQLAADRVITVVPPVADLALFLSAVVGHLEHTVLSLATTCFSSHL